MALSSTVVRLEFAGNGIVKLFSFPHPVLLDADMKLIQRNNTTGVETPKVITTDFTMTGAGTASTGVAITMIVAPPTGETLIIIRDPAATQDLNLEENDNLPAISTEAQLDRSQMSVQRNLDIIGRSIRLTDGFFDALSLELPELIPAETFIRINAAGTGLELFTAAQILATLSAARTGSKALSVGNQTITFPLTPNVSAATYVPNVVFEKTSGGAIQTLGYTITQRRKEDFTIKLNSQLGVTGVTALFTLTELLP